MAAGTQFEWSGGQPSMPIGIKFGSVDIIRRAHKVKSTPALWDRIGVMENEVLKISAAQNERAMKKRG